MIKKMLLATTLLCSVMSVHAADDAATVEANAERIRVLMVDPAKEGLEELVAPQLSYGHSSGRVETKAEFLDSLLSGKSDFLSIKVSEQTVQVIDDVAIVRHTLVGDTHNKGKDPVVVNLKILQVWKKAGNAWQLLARQAVPISN